jgi:CRP-like cAMP-binding protein
VASGRIMCPAIEDESRHQKARPAMNRKAKLSFNPQTFLAKVGDGKAISKYQKGQIVFSQGNIGDAVFFIQKGKIKLTVVSERGKEAVVGILGPDHFFGEGCMNGHPLRVTTATAIDQSLITRIPKAAMIATLHDEPKFSELFMADLLSRNSRIEEDLIDQLFNSSEKRLARVPGSTSLGIDELDACCLGPCCASMAIVRWHSTYRQPVNASYQAEALGFRVWPSPSAD